MRDLTELIDQQRSGWHFVEQLLKEATNHYEVLPRNSTIAGSELHKLQLTTFSPLGAVLFETGGILIDNGWLRVLGSGHTRLSRTLASWTPSLATGQKFKAFLVADDASGGFFAINGGEFGKDHGGVYYFAPDTLEWENLDTNYSGFLHWALSGDLDLFYQSVRWAGWQEEVSSMGYDSIYSFYPFLWTEPQLSIDQRSRNIVPIDEHWSFNLNLQHQLSNM